MFHWGGKTVPRKFVDMLYHLTGKYPSLDPSIEVVKLGDFGNLNTETGAWEADGNIFEIPELAKGVVIKEGEVEKEYRLCSDNGKVVSAGVDASADIVTIASANASVKYEFNDERGALVSVIGMKCRYIEHGVIKSLMNSEQLKGQRLVTQVWQAPAYVTYMSNKGGGSITLSLDGKAPIPSAPGVSAGGGFNVQWKNTYNGGVYREGSEAATGYTPFFTVVRKRGLFRESPLPEGVEPIVYEDAEPPWGDLDEDGEEILPEDF